MALQDFLLPLENIKFQSMTLICYANRKYKVIITDKRFIIHDIYYKFTIKVYVVQYPLYLPYSYLLVGSVRQIKKLRYCMVPK